MRPGDERESRQIIILTGEKAETKMARTPKRFVLNYFVRMLQLNPEGVSRKIP
jgi:hypothetical protein